jgi:uncharacterized damage-inducible protein DinB
MKRREALALSLAAPIALLPAQPAGRLSTWMAPRWATSKAYTLAFVAKMPEEHYGFRPVPEINSFAQQALHIGEGNYLLASAVKGVVKPQQGPKDLTRATLTAFLTASFDYGAEVIGSLSDAAAGETISFFNQKIVKRELCFRMLDHVAHHRGQMVIYLRLKGIVPPEYPG